MLMQQVSWQRRLRGHASRRVRYGFRRHPGLTVVLVGAGLIVAIVLLLVFLAALAVGTAVAALGLVSFQVVRRLLAPSLAGLAPAAAARIRGETAASMLDRYLSAVSEFSRLTEIAMIEPVARRSPTARLRQALRDSERLHDLSRRLTKDWSGSANVRLCLEELEAAAESLLLLLRALSLRQVERVSEVALRWHREDLSRRHDALVEHLRAADLAGAVHPRAREAARH